MLAHTQLEEALTVLGALLGDWSEAYDLVDFGAGALVLVDRQATDDLDVVVRIVDGDWVGGSPTPGSR